MTATIADIVPELKPGMFAWFAPDEGPCGFREVWHVEPWTADPIRHAFNYDLAREWVKVTYTDGFIQDRPRYSSHEVWASGDRPLIEEAQ